MIKKEMKIFFTTYQHKYGWLIFYLSKFLSVDSSNNCPHRAGENLVLTPTLCSGRWDSILFSQYTTFILSLPSLRLILSDMPLPAALHLSIIYKPSKLSTHLITSMKLLLVKISPATSLALTDPQYSAICCALVPNCQDYLSN